VLTPTVVELPVRPEPVTPDTFIAAPSAAAVVVKLTAPSNRTR
jgi:hypothetical protein